MFSVLWTEDSTRSSLWAELTVMFRLLLYLERNNVSLELSRLTVTTQAEINHHHHHSAVTQQYPEWSTLIGLDRRDTVIWLVEPYYALCWRQGSCHNDTLQEMSFGVLLWHVMAWLCVDWYWVVVMTDIWWEEEEYTRHHGITTNYTPLLVLGTSH